MIWIPKHNNHSTCRFVTYRNSSNICDGCKQWSEIILKDSYNYSHEQIEFAMIVKKLTGNVENALAMTNM